MNIQKNELEPEFTPTFTGSRQEQAWIREALSGFYEDRWDDAASPLNPYMPTSMATLALRAR